MFRLPAGRELVPVFRQSGKVSRRVPARFTIVRVRFGLMKKVLLPLGIIGACGAVATWMVLQQPEPSVRNPSPPVLLVDVIGVDTSDVSLNVEASGTVTPRTATTLTSEVPLT